MRSPRHRVRYGAPDREVLRALAEPGASARTTDIPRPGLLAVSAKRRGVSLASGHFPAAAGAHLVAQDLARWRETPGRPVLEITAAGHAKLKRGAAPEPEQFQAQHREVEEAVIEPHGPVKRNEAESPLAWLARRKDRAGRAMLDPASFAAGERFRHDFTLAGLQPRVTSDWSTPVSGAALGDRGMHMTDLMVAARQWLGGARPRARRARHRRLRLPQRAGDCRGRAPLAGPLGKSRARHRAGAACGALGACDGGARAGAAKKLLHWGSEDYRPKVFAEE